LSFNDWAPTAAGTDRHVTNFKDVYMRKLIAITAFFAFIPSAAVFGQAQIRPLFFNTFTALGGNRTFVGTWDVGSSPNNGSPEFTLLFAFDEPGPNAPGAVVCQTMQSAANNVDRGFQDEFECQVIQRLFDRVRVKIRRADIAGDGWGQDLNVSLLMFF
jgi:hypothetical protein